jgi:prepilin-type N-terminal cleavage/methylation domain-containing protein
MKQKRGFTLLELLIVISIMVGLMALLLPAIAKMKKRGKEQLHEVQKRAIISAVSAYRAQYHKWPAPLSDLQDGEDVTYGGDSDDNHLVFDELESPPHGDESVIDMNDFGRRDSNQNILNPDGDQFRITLDLNEDHIPSGGVSVE